MGWSILSKPQADPSLPKQGVFSGLDPEKLHIAKTEFRELEKAGFIRRSNSLWASPLHMVPKKDGSWRPCGDYRRLNNISTYDRYPLPNILDFSTNLNCCTVFSKIYLVKGYHQIPVAPADIQNTAIITPFGLFEYLRMPFGLKNAAQSFQRLMDTIFNGITFVFKYLDDLLIFSHSQDELKTHLHQVLSLLSANGLVINTAKCVFAVPLWSSLVIKSPLLGSFRYPDTLTPFNTSRSPKTSSNSSSSWV